MLHEVTAPVIAESFKSATGQAHDNAITGVLKLVGTKRTADGHEFEFTDEHADLVRWCRDKVLATLAELDDIDVELYVEIKVSLASIDAAMFGTSDVVIVSPKHQTIIVLDNKFGAGVRVYACDNPQLILYAIGALDMFGLLGSFNRVVFGVLQPRLEHHDVAELSTEDVAHWRDKLFRGAQATHKPNPPLHAGEWCKFCPAQATCPALQEHALAVARDIFSDHGAPPTVDLQAWPGEGLSKILAQADMIEDYLNAVKAEAYRRLRDGLDVPGLKLVQGRKVRSWRDQAEIEKWTGGSKLFHSEPELLSVAQTEKVCKREGIPFPQAYVREDYGQPVLALETDKRQAISSGITALPSEDLGL